MDAEQNMTSQTASQPLSQAGSATQSTEVVQLLNGVLADQFVLLVKSLNYHWNVEGIQFREIHKLLEDLYNELFKHIDEVAERVRTVGGRPVATMGEILEMARLKEASQNKHTIHEMLQDLLQDHDSLIRTLRAGAEQCEELGDYGSNDQLTSLLRETEKLAWMLRASIQQ